LKPIHDIFYQLHSRLSLTSLRHYKPGWYTTEGLAGEHLKNSENGISEARM